MYLHAFAVSGTNLIAATDSGVYVSTNNGASWSGFNSGLPNLKVNALGVNGTDVFPGSYDNSVLIRPVSQITTGVNESRSGTPTAFSLSQNYPNPFNPTTTINYQLPMSGQVTLKVFDMLGREIATLVNDNENAGSYSAKFDGSRLASGVYFYRLQAGSFSQTKKLMLVK